MSVCKKCGVPTPGKTECYNCWMDKPPEESREIYYDAISERKEWLTYLQKEVESELLDKSLRGSYNCDILRSAFYVLKNEETKNKREANCSGHDFKYSYSTSHEHIHCCVECGLEE